MLCRGPLYEVSHLSLLGVQDLLLFALVRSVHRREAVHAAQAGPQHLKVIILRQSRVQVTVEWVKVHPSPSSHIAM